jgi:predicted DNA-binding transcriptional regulator AlpA
VRINSKKMHRDILIRLNSIKKPQKHLTTKLGIARSTFWRLSKDKEITTNTFLKLVEWLDKGFEEYITK